MKYNAQNETIRVRILTLCHAQSKGWTEVYKELGWNKSLASRVLNGRIIPSLSQRISLAKALNVDTSTIWDEPVFITAYELAKHEVPA